MKPDCEHCGGSGWLLREDRQGRARAVAQRCGCTRERHVRARLRRARIPAHFARASFESFQAQEEPLKEAKEACQRLVRDYPRRKRGLLLIGSPGVGKTHLAVATLRELLDRHVDALFYDFRDLLDELRSSYDAERTEPERAILERIYAAPVLVLDELGSEKPTEWVREVVHRIIIRRYNDDRLTIFTTNYLDPDHVSRELDPLESLEGRIGYRLRSRLYEMCDTLFMGGADFRRQMSQLERRRSVQAPARVPMEELGQLYSIEQCLEALQKMPLPERERYLAQVDGMLTPRARERKAAELLRRELLERHRAEEDAL